MSTIATVDSLWRYPVKSMRGQELPEAFVGFSGIYGDRLFAFRSSTSPKGFPYLTAREQRRLFQYTPRFRYPDRTARPVNLAEAESIAPGATPEFGSATDLMVDVLAPSGETLTIDDPALIRMVGDGVRGAPGGDAGAIGPGNDGLPFGVARFGPIGSPTGRGDANRRGQTPFSRQHLPGLARRKQLSGG